MIIRPPRTAGRASGVSLAARRSLRWSCGDTSSRAAEPDPIAWRDDYGTALEEAQAANRLLWIQFTGPWCPNCTRMERDSFPHPAVVQHARESFVPLKLRSDVHEQLALSSTFPLCPRRSSSPPTARSSPSIKATSGRPSSTLFYAILCHDCLASRLTKLARRRPAAGPADEMNKPQDRERLAIERLLPGQLDSRS